MADDWDITTGDGSVSLYLPSDFGAELDAHTGDGSDPQRPRLVDGDRAERESPHGHAAGSAPAASSFASAPATGRFGCAHSSHRLVSAP